MNPFVACAVAVAAAIIISVLRKFSPELSAIAVAVAGVTLLVYITKGLLPFVEFINAAAKESGTEPYFALMLKALAISLFSKISADICRDCGENTLASRVELAGKAGIVIISLPVIQQLIELSKDMLG